MGGYKKEMERKYTFHQVIAEDDHSETVSKLQTIVDSGAQCAPKYTLVCHDLAGGFSSGKNSLREQFDTLQEADIAYQTWVNDVGRHLPVQYSGYKYSYVIYDPQGREVVR